jgi:hypothetical protein
MLNYVHNRKLQTRLGITIQERIHEKLPRIEKVTPVRPAPCADWLVCLGTRFDPYVGNPAPFLPLGEVFSDNDLDDPVALNVIHCHGSQIEIVSLAPSFRAYPLNAIEALLKDVIGPGLKVVLFPHAQSIRVESIIFSVLSAKRRNFRSVFSSINSVE